MKKQITYLIISLAIVLIGVTCYVGIQQKRGATSPLDRIPISKPHAHISPEGDIVQHTHTQINPPAVVPQTTDLDTTETIHPILRVWDNLDLADIKRKYQPYTVPEMMEKWDEKYQKLNASNRSRWLPQMPTCPKQNGSNTS